LTKSVANKTGRSSRPACFFWDLSFGREVTARRSRNQTETRLRQGYAAANAFNAETRRTQRAAKLFFNQGWTRRKAALGYVDPGTVAGNAVGLYDVTTSALLASATVTSLDPLTGSFHYSSITPVTLTAGDTYAVVGYYGDSTAVGYTADSGVGAAPEITFLGYKYDNNGSLDIPTIGYTPPIFGANFQYEVSAVPEPTTMIAGALLLLHFGASTLRILRKKQTA